MALLIQRLPNLEILHLGDYYINFSATMTHRLEHEKYHSVKDRLSDVDVTVHNRLHLGARRNNDEDNGPPVNDAFPLLAPLELWDAHCPECERGFASQTEAAERRAAAVLATHVWSLQTISFASFFSEKRIRPSSWYVRRRAENVFGGLLSAERTQALGSSDVASGRLRVETSRTDDFRYVRSETFEREEGRWLVVN